jgi:hypothetical protein
MSDHYEVVFSCFLREETPAEVLDAVRWHLGMPRSWPNGGELISGRHDLPMIVAGSTVERASGDEGEAHAAELGGAQAGEVGAADRRGDGRQRGRVGVRQVQRFVAGLELGLELEQGAEPVPTTVPSRYTGSQLVTACTRPSSSTAMSRRTSSSTSSSSPPRVKPSSGRPRRATHSSEMARICGTTAAGALRNRHHSARTPSLRAAHPARAGPRH